MVETSCQRRFTIQCRSVLRSADGSPGGDFIEYYESPSRLTFFVGDACGHGRAAVPLKMRLSGDVAELVSLAVSPGTALTILHKAICTALDYSRADTGCATLFFGCIDPERSTFTYASAGHATAFALAPGAAPRNLAPTGPLLGLDAALRFEERTIGIESAMSLLIATDGLVEARSHLGQGRYGTARLTQTLAAAASLKPPELVSRLLADVERFSRGGCDDDIALFSASVENIGEYRMRS
jgi:sigma-B regulation protein RsbU (phosphoserine phosphatase)